MYHNLLMFMIGIIFNVAAFYLGFCAAKTRNSYKKKRYSYKNEKRRMLIVVLILILFTIIALIVDLFAN